MLDKMKKFSNISQKYVNFLQCKFTNLKFLITFYFQLKLKTLGTKSNKSLKSLKSNFSNKKSLREKSLFKSSQSLSKPKSAASISSAKSTKSTNTLPHSMKSVGSLGSKVSSKKSKSPTSMQFTLSKAGISKRKMTFLKSNRVSRKSMVKSVNKSAGKKSAGKKSLGRKSPERKSLGRKSSGKKSPGKKSPGSKSKLNHSSVKTNKESVTRGHDTFDQNEFLDFMKVNDLSYLIRSASICKMGFQIKFSRQCLTVFSSSNFYRENEGAVALIDSTSYSIRFIRYKASLFDGTTPNNQQVQSHK